MSIEKWGLEVSDAQMLRVKFEAKRWKDIAVLAKSLANILRKSEGRLNTDSAVVMLHQVAELAKNCTPVAICPWCNADGGECSRCMGTGAIGPLLMDAAKEMKK